MARQKLRSNSAFACLLVTAAVLVTASSVQAQLPSLWLLEHDSLAPGNSAIIRLDGSAALQTTGIDMGFVRSLLLGGYLDDARIEKTFERLHEYTYGGAGLGAGINLYSMAGRVLGHDDLGLHVRATHVVDLHGSMRKSAFDLAFRGNAHLEGQRADAGLFYQQTVFQKYGIGVFSRSSMSEVSLSFVNGQSFERLFAKKAEFTTYEGVDSLKLDYNATYMRSDTSTRGFAVSEGQGFSLDAAFNIGLVTISVQHLGLVRWNGNFETYDYDSSYVWNGIDITDIASLTGDTPEIDQRLDSLQVSPNRGARWMPLPAMAEIRLISMFRKQFYSEGGIRLRYNLVGLPEVFAAAGIKPWKHHLLCARATAGGYGRLRAGIEYQWMHPGGTFLRLGTDNAPGFVSEWARGTGLFLTFAKII